MKLAFTDHKGPSSPFIFVVLFFFSFILQGVAGINEDTCIKFSYEWKKNIIGMIKYAKITEQNEVIVQNYQNQVMKFDIEGNQQWSISIKQGELVKIQLDWAILFESISKSVIYVSLADGDNQKRLSYGNFKQQIPFIKSSENMFMMYDSSTVFLVKSEKAINADNQLFSNRYSLKQDYEILKGTIGKDSQIYLLLLFQSKQVCFGVLDSSVTITSPKNEYLQIIRCKNTTLNRSSIVNSSRHGFIYQDQQDFDKKVIKLIYLESQEEDFFIAREDIQQVKTFDQNEIVILQYSEFYEICKFSQQEFLCLNLIVKKNHYHFIPTFNGASILFLYSDSAQDQTQNEKELKDFTVQLFDLDNYEVVHFGKVSFEESVSFVYARTNFVDSRKQPSVSILVTTNKRSSIFLELYPMQVVYHSVLSNDMLGELKPIFYRYQNQILDPYPNQEHLHVGTTFDFTQFTNSIWKRITYRLEQDVAHIKKQFYSFYYKNIITMKLLPSNISENEDKLYGIEKIILIPTKQFVLFGINSINGEQIYKKNIVSTEQDAKEVVGIMSLDQDSCKKEHYSFYDQLTQEKKYHSCGEKQYYLVIKNQKSMSLLHINPETGDTLRLNLIYFNQGESFSHYSKAKLIQDSRREHLIIFSVKNNFKIFPSLSEQEEQAVNALLKKSKPLILHQNQQSIEIFRMIDLKSPLTKSSFFNLKSNQKVIKIVHNFEELDFSSKRGGLIPIESDGKDSYRSTDLESNIFGLLCLSSAEKYLVLYLVDASTSKVLKEKRFSNVDPSKPIDMILKYNHIIISFFSNYYSKQILFEMKFYYRHFATIFDLPVISFPPNSLVSDDKTFFSEQSISKLHTFILEEHLILTNYQNDILSIRLSYLNSSASSAILQKFNKINSSPLHSIQSIYYEPTSLSSQFLLFANGAQIFSTLFIPEGRFDSLPLDFNYQGVIFSLYFVFALLLISFCVYGIRRMKANKFVL